MDHVRPLLEKVSAVIVHAGPSGAGSTLKLVNNLIMGVAIEAVAEALVLARKAGIDPDCVRQITTVGGARTGAMETRGSRMLAHDFSPHFSTDNMHKDLSTALRACGSRGSGGARGLSGPGGAPRSPCARQGQLGFCRRLHNH